MLKFLSRLVLYLREKHTAVVYLVVNEIAHVPVAFSIRGRDRSLKIRANDSANAIDWRVVSGILLRLAVAIFFALSPGNAMRLFMVGQLNAIFRLGSEVFNGGVALVAKANMKLILDVLMHAGVVLVD